jgi:hypothetical protein
VDVPDRWAISGTDKHMLGTASNEYGFNTQWSDGPHPTAHQIPTNASKPTLRLATGCSQSSCITPEVQMFSCTADNGKLALIWNGHSRTNIDVHASQEDLKRIIETLPGTSSSSSFPLQCSNYRTKF